MFVGFVGLRLGAAGDGELWLSTRSSPGHSAGDPQNLKEDSRSSKGGPDLGSWTTKRALDER